MSCLVEQVVVEQGHGRHGLHDGDGTRQDARVVTSTGCDVGVMSGRVDSRLFHEYRGHGLECHAEIDVLSVADAALYASRVVGARVDAPVVVIEEVILLRAGQVHASEAFAIFEALCCIDAEHGGPQCGVEFAEGGLAQSDRAAADDTRDDAAYGVATAFHGGYQRLHLPRLFRVGAAHRVLFDEAEIIVRVGTFEGDGADLRRVGRHRHAQLPEGELRERAAHAAGDGLACRRASASAVVAQAVFAGVCVVGMRGAEEAAQVLVVGRVLVRVAHEEADGATRRAAFEDA